MQCVPEDIIRIASPTGMVWYIIPLEEGKKHSRYVINHRFKNGRLAVEEKTYRTLDDALNAVRKRQARNDYDVLHQILHPEK